MRLKWASLAPLLLVAGAACEPNTDSYRTTWCATYCTEASRAAACDSECGLDAGHSGIDASVADAGARDSGVTDAGRRDSGIADSGVADSGAFDAGVADSGAFDAGSVDAGVLDAGDLDAGPAPDAGYVVLAMGDGGALQGSAGSCVSVALSVFESDGFPSNAANSTVTITTTADTLVFANAACTGTGTLHTATARLVGGTARFFLNSPTYGPQHFEADSTNGEHGSFDVDFTARAVLHVAPSTLCADADVATYSSDGKWTLVGPPPGANDEYLFSNDAGDVPISFNYPCDGVLSVVGVPASSVVHFLLLAFDDGGTVNVRTHSALVSPASALVSPDPNMGTGNPGDACTFGCAAGGCVIESTPVCECIAQGQPCVLGVAAGAGCCNPSLTMDICGGSTSICE